MLLGAKSERIQSNGISNTCSSETSVAIPNLVPGEVLKVPGGEAVGTVKDDLDLGVTGGTRNIGNETGCSTTSSVID